MEPLPSAELPTQSSPTLRSESNSELSSSSIQRQGHATANTLRSSKERFIFNPITLQSQYQSQSNSRDGSNQSLNKSVDKTSRFTNLTKMLPKRPPSPTLSNSEPPNSPPPPVPTSSPPNMFPATKRSSLTGVINFSGLDRILSNRKTDSKPPSTPPSPQLTPSHSSSSQQPELYEELHFEMETMLDVFNQERTSILQEMSQVKGLWLRDRKKAKRDMEQHAIRVSNSLKRYDSLVVEMTRQFSTVANELNHLKENQRKLQNEMHRKLEAIRNDLIQFKGDRPDQMLTSELKESSESLNIPPVHATMDKSIGRTISVDSNMQKLSGNRLSKLGKRFSQPNLTKEEGSTPRQSSEKLIPSSGKVKVKENESRTVNKKKIEKFFGETPPHTEDLSSFLTRLGYERYLANFEKEEITLIALFHMSEEHLICLNIPMGPRLIILREAYELAKVFKHHNINTA